MQYICPKCGKKMDLSTEVLINSEYKVICPQCLSQLHIVGDYAYIPDGNLDLDTSVQPSQTFTCPNCGHEATTGAHFCPNCGTSFDSDASAEPIQEVMVEDATILPPPLPDADPLYNDALQYLMTCSAITPMMLRDHFHISDERAALLLSQLEKGGAVGPYNNGGPRRILIPHQGLYQRPAVWQASQEQMSDDPGDSGERGNYRHRGSGCFTYILIFFFIMILMKACGM